MLSAVPSAGVIAREEFPIVPNELSAESAADMHMCAGHSVGRAAARFAAILGRAGSTIVAKLHFENALKVRD